jgi:hypothetical protein
MAGWSRKVVHFYNQRGTAEQWIKESKYAVKWTRLSCRSFKDNQARLQLFVLAYNLGNFLRRLVLPRSVKHWSLTTLREKLIKIGAKVVRHARYVTFQLAEVAVPRELFAAILDRIQRFGVPPPLGQRGCPGDWTQGWRFEVAGIDAARKRYRTAVAKAGTVEFASRRARRSARRLQAGATQAVFVGVGWLAQLQWLLNI